MKVVILTVTEGNASAVRLHESAGLRAFGTDPMAVCTGVGYKAKVHMQCVLGLDVHGMPPAGT